jgi:putative tryptophan/tyrosine transport system substrate-binding protein
VQPDGYTLMNRGYIIELAVRHRLPTIHDRRIEAAEGGLASYGADLLDLYRRSAAYVDLSRAKVLPTCRYSNRSSMSWW